MSIDFENPTPLYLQIASDIRKKIDENILSVGEKIPSQAELSQSYDVSLITVKKALSELVNQKYLFSRAGKGTYVADINKSRQLDLEKNKSIGVVLKDLSSPFFSLIIKGVEAAAYKNGYNLLVSHTADKMEKEEKQVEHFKDIGVKGLIIASMLHTYRKTDYMRELQDAGFPFVLVSYIEDDDVDYVGVDHEMGAYLAGKHLVKLGHERIGYIQSEKGNVLGEVRFAGFIKAMNEYGKKVNEDDIYYLPYKGEQNYFKSGHEIGNRFALLHERPTALCTYNDLSALGFKKAVLEKGIRIPDDVALVGFDDIEMSSQSAITLTTVRQPTFEIGKKAFEILLSKLNGDTKNQRYLFKPKLIIRKSCGALLK
ncbi:MAG: GntR family transcriptional regulator [Gemmatimonadota bacterium]|nr:MAG: GntR family transcriptional regulator [Gemmatimonadota bacterium]